MKTYENIIKFINIKWLKAKNFIILILWNWQLNVILKLVLHMSPDDHQLHFLGPELCLLQPLTEQKQI